MRISLRAVPDDRHVHRRGVRGAAGLRCGRTRGLHASPRAGGNYNEGVFSAVLPPGGSVTDSWERLPSGGQQRAWLAAEQRIGQRQPRQPGRVGGRRAGRAWRSSPRRSPAGGSPPSNINNSDSPWGGGVYWAGGGQEIPTRARRPGLVVWVCLPVLRVPARLRRHPVRPITTRRAAGQRDGQLLGSRDGRPVVERAERAVAVDRLGARASGR